MTTFVKANAKAIAAFIVASVAGLLASHHVTLDEALQSEAQALVAALIVWFVRNKQRG